MTSSSSEQLPAALSYFLSQYCTLFLIPVLIICIPFSTFKFSHSPTRNSSAQVLFLFFITIYLGPSKMSGKYKVLKEYQMSKMEMRKAWLEGVQLTYIIQRKAEMSLILPCIPS